MNYRTDLALERINLTKLEDEKGLKQEVSEYDNMKISEVEILSDDVSKKLRKDKGKYITIEVPSFSEWTITDEFYIEVISSKLKTLFPNKKDFLTLVVGLGNDDITPDALGIKSVNKIIATRHIKDEFKKAMDVSYIGSVASFCPSVTGKTGVETAEVIKAVCDKIKPDLVILIDAFACSDVNRLGTTIQIADTGISPGSGVQNKRKELNKNFLGTEVISIGIPTVVDALTLLLNMSGEEAISNIDKENIQKMHTMMITPKEIDLIIERSSALLSVAINKALQPCMSIDDIVFLNS